MKNIFERHQQRKDVWKGIEEERASKEEKSYAKLADVQLATVAFDDFFADSRNKAVAALFMRSDEAMQEFRRRIHAATRELNDGKRPAEDVQRQVHERTAKLAAAILTEFKEDLLK